MKEPKFRLFQSIEELKIEIPKIKSEWEKIKKEENKPFSEFTDSKIEELEQLLNSDLKEYIILSKSTSIISMLDNEHFKINLTLDDVFLDTYSSDKIMVFIKYQNQLSDNEYWKKLAEIYTQQDYNPVPYEILFALFNSPRKGKENLMNEEEKNIFNSLPDQIRIYRSMSKNELESGKFRFSWTLDEEVADNFMERSEMLYDDEMIIHSILINKNDALAYLDGRNEKEIIYIQNDEY